MYTMHLPRSLHKHDTKSSFTINIWFFNKLINFLVFFFFSIFNDGSMTANQSKNMNQKFSYQFFFFDLSISIEYEIFFLRPLVTVVSVSWSASQRSPTVLIRSIYYFLLRIIEHRKRRAIFRYWWVCNKQIVF